jgi:hypothetical protein
VAIHTPPPVGAVPRGRPPTHPPVIARRLSLRGKPHTIARSPMDCRAALAMTAALPHPSADTPATRRGGPAWPPAQRPTRVTLYRYRRALRRRNTPAAVSIVTAAAPPDTKKERPGYAPNRPASSYLPRAARLRSSSAAASTSTAPPAAIYTHVKSCPVSGSPLAVMVTS